MSQTELVTVYITTKDRLKLLKRAISSVFTQTYENWELIIVDDGSSDGTAEFLDELQSGSARVTVISNSVSKGACHARNSAIALAKGEYLTGLDDDDYYKDHRLSQLMEAYISGDYSFVCSTVIMVSKTSTIVINRSKSFLSFNDLYYANSAGSQILTETAKVRAVGGFDPYLSSCQDLDLWIRVAKKFGVARKISDPSYVLDTSHDEPRISTGLSRSLGQRQFLLKHEEHMSAWQINSFKFTAAANGGHLRAHLLVRYFAPKVFHLQLYTYFRRKLSCL